MGCALTFTVVSGATAQTERPAFAGKWTAIPERNAPAGSSPVLGSSLTIEQTASDLTIARVSAMTVVAKGPDGKERPQTIERATSNTYRFDGVERELATATPQMAGGRGGQGTLDLASTYRAVWTTDQLVIITFGRASEALSARTKGQDKVGQLKQVSRMSLALEPDGTLVVDRVTVLDPEAGGPKESAPVVVRSIYHRVK